MAQEVGELALFFEILAALLAAFGLVCLGWLAFGRLLLPVGGGETPACAVVLAVGDGGALEQTVSGLLWLRRTGLWRGRILIVDRGLDREGLAVARRFAGEGGVELRPAGAACREGGD